LPQTIAMQIVVIAEGLKQNEFHDKGIAEGVQLQLVTSIEEANAAEAYFYLLEEDTIAANKKAIENLGKVVFVNAVTTTLDALPANAVRVNAWPGFLLSKSLEVVFAEENKREAAQVLDALSWAYNIVPDLVGMITPRTIAMIVNEAYFALGDEVSSKEEIDIAMKLGTGYPFGPFEWSQKIGLEKIHQLLTVLAASDKRYEPAPLLTQETVS
jgi:3-hydroxybutyryl-CoA dehydrogenase